MHVGGIYMLVGKRTVNRGTKCRESRKMQYVEGPKKAGTPSIIPEARFPRMSLLGFSVNRGRPASLTALLNLLALEGFHHLRRNIGVVVHHLPFSAFAPVDVRHPPINAYRFVSKLRLAMFGS